MPIPDVFFGRHRSDIDINDALALVVFRDGTTIALGANSVYEDSPVKLGLGTLSPAHAVHVLAAAAVRLLVETTAASTADLAVKNSARTWLLRINSSGNFALVDTTTAASPVLVAAGAAANSLAIDSAGRVGIGAAAPNAAAKLQIDSTTQGVLLPRMTTTQRDAISSPPDGLQIYNASTSKFQGRAGGAWVDFH